MKIASYFITRCLNFGGNFFSVEWNGHGIQVSTGMDMEFKFRLEWTWNSSFDWNGHGIQVSTGMEWNGIAVFFMEWNGSGIKISKFCGMEWNGI